MPAATQAFAGESSTAYACLPRLQGVVERIARDCPDPHFIYVMRDPVERTISQYWWNVRFEGETRDPLSAIRADHSYCNVSYYAMQLRPYFERFGRERVKPIIFEHLVANTEAVLRDIFTWLGVDSSIALAASERHENVTPPEIIQTRDRPHLVKLRNSPLWNVIGPRMPAFVRWIGRSLVERRVDRARVMLDDVYDFLRPIQREQTNELSVLLGRQFPEWGVLNEQQ